MKRIFSALFACTLVFATFSCFAAEGDQIFTFTNKKGTITFNHTAHKTRAAGKDKKVEEGCAKCHSDEAGIPKKFDDGVSLMKQGHSVCKKCHTESGGAAPTKCDDCHKKT